MSSSYGAASHLMETDNHSFADQAIRIRGNRCATWYGSSEKDAKTVHYNIINPWYMECTNNQQQY